MLRFYACRVLNERATIISTKFGDASLWDVLPARAASSSLQRDVAPSAELELMLNGINCGGCGSAVD